MRRFVDVTTAARALDDVRDVRDLPRPERGRYPDDALDLRVSLLEKR